MVALTRPLGAAAGHTRLDRLPHGSQAPAASGGDRRLLAFVCVSLALHLLVMLEWGFDDGRRPAQSPSVLAVRLAPGAGEPVRDPWLTALVAAATSVQLQAAPGQLEPQAAPGSGAVPTQSPAADAPTNASLPAAASMTMPSPGAQPAVVAGEPEPKAGVERAGSSDLTWYTGRDLDVLPRPLGPIEPAFPINAQLRGVSGKVTLAVSIDASGRVIEVEIVRAEPPGFFEEAARAAFAGARYSPGIKDGHAVRARLQTVVVFDQAVLRPGAR